MIEPIVQVYKQASASERQAGRAFYPSARGYCLNLAAEHGIDLERVVGVCAVISPGLTWAFNRRELESVLDAWGRGINPSDLRLVAYRANRAKAVRILGGDLGALHGSKVTAFYQCILSGGACQHIVIDRWAARAAGIMKPAWIHPALYRRLESAYLGAAERLGLDGTILQAIVWYTVQRLSKNWAYKLNLQEA